MDRRHSADCKGLVEAGDGAVRSAAAAGGIPVISLAGDGREVSLGPGISSVDASVVERLASFHGYLATGVFIGLQMLTLGRSLLGLRDGDRIHVLCETFNCLPDPFQCLCGCTIGNKGLIVRDTGKMAVTMTPHTPPGEKARGVRIVFDVQKTRRYPRLHAWYMKTEKVGHEELVRILTEAGEGVYSYEYLDVPVSARPRKVISVCPVCGESYIVRGEGLDSCVDCADAKVVGAEIRGDLLNQDRRG